MQIFIISGGYVGKTQSKKLQNGNTMTTLSVGTTKSKKDKQSGEWTNETTWHYCSVFNKSAEYCERNIRKGDKVNLVGEVVKKPYEKNGEPVERMFINVKEIEKIYEPRGQQGSSAQRSQQQRTQNQYKNLEDDFQDDDIPF